MHRYENRDSVYGIDFPLLLLVPDISRWYMSDKVRNATKLKHIDCIKEITAEIDAFENVLC